MDLIHIFWDLKFPQFAQDCFKSKSTKLDTESSIEPMPRKPLKCNGQQLHGEFVPTQLSGEHPKYFELQLLSST